MCVRARIRVENLGYERANVGCVKTITQIYLQKVVSCINLQLPIVLLKKNYYFRHVSSCNVHACISIFSKFELVDQSKSSIYIFANNRKLHKFATTNSNFEKID